MNATEHNATGSDSHKVSDAYLKLMDWQYNYVQEHKAAFDFITGKDYIESGGKKADLKQEQKEKEKKAKAEQKDLQEAQKEMGIENNASNKNMIVAALLFILILGCGIILKHKKTKDSK